MDSGGLGTPSLLRQAQGRPNLLPEGKGTSRRERELWELQHSHDLGCAAPEALQVVEFSFLGREYVDYYVAEIQEDPTGSRRSLPSMAWHTGLLQRLRQVLFQCLYLTGRFSRHNHKIVGEWCQAAKVEEHDILGKFVSGLVYDELRHFQGFQLPFLHVFGRMPTLFSVPSLLEYRRV